MIMDAKFQETQPSQNMAIEFSGYMIYSKQIYCTSCVVMEFVSYIVLHPYSFCRSLLSEAHAKKIPTASIL